MPQPLWCIELIVPDAGRPAFEDTLAEHALSVSAFEAVPGVTWQVNALCHARPDDDLLHEGLSRTASALACPVPAVRVYLMPERDWVLENRNNFPPLFIGRYAIHGSHDDASAYCPIVLELDAGAAFGSGEHATTRGCLLAFDHLARQRRFRRVLDMGCGSGILALAAAATWRSPVIASDIDPVAAATADENARRNGLSRLVRTNAAPGYEARVIAAGGPYDLIVSNILARPLCRMAGDLARHLRPARHGGGVAILSGFIGADGRRVLAAHQSRGLRLLRRLEFDGWQTLVLER